MNEEVYKYRNLITNMYRISNRIRRVIYDIDRFGRVSSYALTINDESVFNKNIESVRELLEARVNLINNTIIPQLREEMQIAATV